MPCKWKLTMFSSCFLFVYILSNTKLSIYMVSLGRWIPNVNHNRSGSLVSNGIAYRACHSSDTANKNCRCLRPCMYHLYALGCVVHENEYDAALCQSCNVEPPLDQVYYSLSLALFSLIHSLTPHVQCSWLWGYWQRLWNTRVIIQWTCNFAISRTHTHKHDHATLYASQCTRVGH